LTELLGDHAGALVQVVECGVANRSEKTVRVCDTWQTQTPAGNQQGLDSVQHLGSTGSVQVRTGGDDCYRSE
jgi:hypothetical protein